MNRPTFQLLFAVAAAICLAQFGRAADECLTNGSPPTCGKVCKLVCETKKLTSTCYGSESKDICTPDPSRVGCKHCAECYGQCLQSTAGCDNCPPKCQFCWRDWFPCGCAEPRCVRVLTKYQAEKKICWYHWEVVDGACCDCVSKNGTNGAGDTNSAAQAHRTIYNPAPDDAHIGEVLPITEEEWVKLAASLSTDPTEVAAGAPPKTAVRPNDEIKPLEAPAKAPSVAERLQRMWKK